MLIHFFAKSLNIFSRSIILTIRIAKLFSLSCEIVDRKLLVINLKNFFHLMQLLQALLGKPSKQ